MSELLKRTDQLWSGQASTAQPDYHPFGGPRMLEELAPGVAFFKAFVNVTAVSTGDGLVLVGSPETVIRALQAGQQRMGYDVFCTNHQIGRMPSELVDRSIELFGKEVIPAFASATVGAR